MLFDLNAGKIYFFASIALYTALAAFLVFALCYTNSKSEVKHKWARIKLEINKLDSEIPLEVVVDSYEYKVILDRVQKINSDIIKLEYDFIRVYGRNSVSMTKIDVLNQSLDYILIRVCNATLVNDNMLN
jgi:hypothetical protein